MKKFHFTIVFLLAFVLPTAFAGTDQKEDISVSRKKLCVEAGGTPENTVIKAKNRSIHVDCKCGEFGFNPHLKGDICRNHKILPEFDHYCMDSKAQIETTTNELGLLRQCKCGDKVIDKPSLTTMCINGAVVVKQHAPEPTP